MVLLNPYKPVQTEQYYTILTFHYGAIESAFGKAFFSNLYKLTFHYGAIESFHFQ